MNELQKALKINALFSGISGTILILLNQHIAILFGVNENAIFWIVGLVLIYFSLTIGYEIKKQRRVAILWIITQDYAWVLGSVILIIFNPYEVTKSGLLIIGIVAIIVLYMGIHQMIGLNKTSNIN